MTLGERIRARRRELDLTQNEVAIKTKISKSHISEIEKGTKNPSIQVLNDIAISLGVRANYFLDDQETTLDDFCKVYMKLPRNKKDLVRRVVREMLR